MATRIGLEYAGITRALAQARVQRGITQVELDDRLGTSDGQVAKWESHVRRPSPFLLLCWASALGLGLALVPLGQPASQPVRQLTEEVQLAQDKPLPPPGRNTEPSPPSLTASVLRPRPRPIDTPTLD